MLCLKTISMTDLVIMPPTLKKLEGHIAFGLSVCVGGRVGVCICLLLLNGAC